MVTKIHSNGTEEILADSAIVQSPAGIHVDDDSQLYIAELGGHRVIKIDRNGKVSTIAGTGTAGYSR